MSLLRSQSARRLLVVCAVLLLSLVLAGCGSGQQAQSADGSTNIKVGTIPIDATAQVFYAKEQGYFEEEGLNVEIQTITNGAAIVSAVQSGALQVGCSNVVSIATAIERGLSFDFVAPGLSTPATR